MDSSGSMEDDWSGLMSSFDQTMQTIKNIYQQTNKAKISIMGFDDHLNLTCENMNPDSITKPSYTGGGTDFDNPFNKTVELARRYINNSTVVFIFMTDGQASYPTKGIDDLK